jgi:hypothetical protein
MSESPGTYTRDISIFSHAPLDTELKYVLPNDGRGTPPFLLLSPSPRHEESAQ